MGAQLACGPDVAVSFDSAAAVWGLAEDVATPHVTVPLRTSRKRPGIIVYRSSELEVVTHQRFRVTSPMRTITDLAGRWDEERLERSIDVAHRRRLIDIVRFSEYVRRDENRTRPGVGVLKEMLDARDPRRPIGSDLETLLFRALRKAGLPVPVPQHPVRTRHGMRFIDFAYPEYRLAIELDGFEEHGTRRAFEADRVRQNELEELGFTFRRFTWTQLRADPADVAVTVGVALGLVPTRWGPRGGRAPTARHGGGASAALLPRKTHPA
jgi:very-short-patch-repair endonuclease